MEHDENTGTPLLSIIVSVFNVDNYLEQCLESIVGQTYKNLEIILVDDGSQDSSGDICDKFAARDQRVKVIHQEHQGPSGARNVALDIFSGDYVLFVDSDDYVDEQYAEKLLKAIEDLDVSCVMCGYASFNDNYREPFPPCDRPIRVTAEQCLKQFVNETGKEEFKLTTSVWNRIYKRYLFTDKHIRFPEGRIFEDLAIVFPIIHHSREIGMIPDILYFYRNRSGSIVNSKSEKHLLDLYQAYIDMTEPFCKEYPEMERDAKRRAELERINIWTRWLHFVYDEKSASAKKEVESLKTLAESHIKDLFFPKDLEKYIIYLLLLFTPRLAHYLRKLRHLFDNSGSLTKNALLYGGTLVLGYLFSFFTVFYVARFLKADALGRVSFANSIIGFFTIAAQLGIPIYGMRLAARERNERTRLSQSVSELFSISLALNIAAVAILAAIVLLIPRLYELKIIFLILALGMVADNLGMEWLYKGLDKYAFLFKRCIIVRLTALTLLILSVRSDADVYYYALVIASVLIVGCIINFLFLSKIVKLRLSPNFNLASHLRPVLVFFLMSCAIMIYTNIDMVMLGFMRGDTETGLYFIATRAKLALTAVGVLIWNISMPRASLLWKQKNILGLEQLARKTLGFVSIAQLCSTIFFFIFAEKTIELTAGKDFLQAVPAFRILLMTLLPIGINNIVGGQVLIACGEEKKLLKAEIFGVIINVILNALLISPYGGNGAAVSTVASEIAVTSISYWYMKKTLHLNLFPWDKTLTNMYHKFK